MFKSFTIKETFYFILNYDTNEFMSKTRIFWEAKIIKPSKNIRRLEEDIIRNVDKEIFMNKTVNRLISFGMSINPTFNLLNLMHDHILNHF